MRWRSSVGNLFHPKLCFLGCFCIHYVHLFSGQPVRVCLFFSLDRKVSNKEFAFFIFFLQKIRRPVLNSYKEHEADFDRCSTEMVVQQIDVVKHSFSAAVVKSRKALHAYLLKTEPPRGIFQRI